MSCDCAEVSIAEAVRGTHPQGIDVLIDLASDADGFTTLASLVRRSGTALTTRYVADTDALGAANVTGINFCVGMTPSLLARLADEIMSGRCTPPPITTVKLADIPGLLAKTGALPAGKTVILVS
jgi:NADPH2:quinone reductase